MTSLESEDDDDDDVAAEVGLAVVMIRGDVNERAGWRKRGLKQEKEENAGNGDVIFSIKVA